MTDNVGLTFSVGDTKVEGAKTNTYKRLPITNILLSWSVAHGVRAYGPQSDVFRCH